MKRAHKGTFHWWSKKHLHRYVCDLAGYHNIRGLGTMGRMGYIVTQPPPQVPMPRHKAQEWYDVLVRLRPLAELRDIKGAKNARRDAEFEWHWFTQTLAKEIADEEDTGKQADILESMAEELRKTGDDG